MPTRNINLTDHYDEFIEQQLASGRYGNVSEVMRAGLRLLEHQAATEAEKLSLLRGLAAQGFHEIDQGQGIEVGDRQQLEKLVAQIGLRAAERAQGLTKGG